MVTEQLEQREPRETAAGLGGRESGADSPAGEVEPVEPESAAVLTAAFTMYRASEQLAALDAESRAIARLAAEALLRGDVNRTALALVARVEGRSGILALLRGSAQSQSS